jgi:hypothetical protein
MKKQMTIDEFKQKIAKDKKNIKESNDFLNKLKKQILDFKEKQKNNKVPCQQRIDSYDDFKSSITSSLETIKYGFADTFPLLKAYERLALVMKNHTIKITECPELISSYSAMIKIKNITYHITYEELDNSVWKYFIYKKGKRDDLCSCKCCEPRNRYALKRSIMHNISSEDVLNIFPELVFMIDDISSHVK